MAQSAALFYNRGLVCRADITVSDDATGADQTTNEIIAYKISDGALENAASIGRAGNYTVVFCTALDLRPGP